MKKLAIAACVLACGITASQAVILIPAGSGTFLTQGETDTFNLYVTSTPSVIQKVTITLTSAAQQTGTVVTNVDSNPASFDGTITSNYTAQLLGFLNGGTINLSDTQSSGLLTPGNGFTFNVSDSGSVVIEYTGLLATFFASPSAATGNIQATTLSSGFGVDVTPLGSSFLTQGGSSSTSYTWNVVYTVPEPSAALLGGLGLLGLLRRRR